MSELIVIVAGTYEQFVTYCRTNNLNPKDNKKVLFVNNVQKLMGRHLCRDQVIHYGTWWELPEAREIERELELCYTRQGVELPEYPPST
jgi:hypothetical protein